MLVFLHAFHHCYTPCSASAGAITSRGALVVNCSAQGGERG